MFSLPLFCSNWSLQRFSLSYCKNCFLHSDHDFISCSKLYFMHHTAESDRDQICYADKTCSEPLRFTGDPGGGGYAPRTDYHTCCALHGGGAHGLAGRNCNNCPNEGVFTNKPIGESEAWILGSFQQRKGTVHFHWFGPLLNPILILLSMHEVFSGNLSHFMRFFCSLSKCSEHASEHDGVLCEHDE